MENNIILKDNLIENDIVRDTLFIENEMSQFMTTEEGEHIKADVQLLQDMGYDKKMINKVYILLQPENLERAIDFMTEIDGVYQHNFFENHSKTKEQGLCFICKKTKKFHMDYIPIELISENQNNNLINIIDNNNNDDYNDSFNFSLDQDNNNDKKDSIKSEKDNLISNECNVCFDDVEEEEKKFNALPCGHVCCTQCWLNYFKTLITEAKVEEIKCVDHQCKEIVPEEFILKHIKDDNKLVEKYHKFKRRAEIINDKNKKPCPKPDCESYLEKSNTTKYVKCKNGHQFCYECLKPPHGNINCDDVLEKDFLKWKKNKRVKRCPRCKIFTEKNEGCNHMTCISCKYQWCWLCEGKYSYGHYNSGECKGHQFTRADNLKQANKRICCLTVQQIFPCFYQRFNHPLYLDSILLRYIGIFVMWIFGFFLFSGFSMFIYFDRHIRLQDCTEIIFISIGIFIALSLFTCFQILFICLITPFMIISLFYPYYFDKILMFLNIGE